jgi:hypothetical protein
MAGRRYVLELGFLSYATTAMLLGMMTSLLTLAAAKLQRSRLPAGAIHSTGWRVMDAIRS